MGDVIRQKGVSHQDKQITREEEGGCERMLNKQEEKWQLKEVDENIKNGKRFCTAKSSRYI